MKVSELKDQTLDWAVAKARNLPVAIYNTVNGQVIYDAELLDMNVDSGAEFNPSTNWNLAGPLIESEMIAVTPADYEGFEAFVWPKGEAVWGDTALEAICRCFVKSKLGDEIDLPEEL